MQRILLATALSFLFVYLPAQCVTNVNFNSWQQAGQPGNGSWSVQGGGTTIQQSVNASGPTFYISPFDLMNVHVTGRFRCTDGILPFDGDNDYMGFAFSFLNPMGPTDQFDCWLFDWKKEDQGVANGTAQQGMSLCRANGLIPSSQYDNLFWLHNNSPEFTVVQNNFGSAGWQWNNWHDFEMYLTYSRVQIFIDGALKFDHSDCFQPGRFGFYNLSQEDCEYANFQYDLFVDFTISQPNVCLGNPTTMEFVHPCVTLPISQYANITWNFGDGQSVTVNNPTNATANVAHTYAASGNYIVTLTVTDNNGCTESATHTVQVRNPITLAPTIVQPLCNGTSTGSISVAPSGGFGNFSYLWNPGAISNQGIAFLPAGTYTVSVTDGSCNTTAQYTLNQPTALSATTSHTNATCGNNDGTATIAITGGTPPYANVTWAGQPGYTVGGFGPGTYIANFVDANGCSAALQYTETIIQLPCGITSSTSVTNVSCFGGTNGTATLTVTGSTPPVNITWNGGSGSGATVTGLAPGTYTYNYTDANPAHAFSGTVTITGPTAPMNAQLSTVGITCAGANNGQAIASVVSGGVPPYNYAWNPAGANNPVRTGLSPGAVTVTITDANGCSAVATGSVSSIPSLSITLSPGIDSCYYSAKGSVISTVSGGSQPYSYDWSTLSTDTALFGINQGTYSLTVTDNNGCSTSATTTVTGPSAQLFAPRVTQDVACFGTSTGSITINTSGGTAPYNYSWTPGSVSGSSPTGLAPGIYVCSVTDAYGCLEIVRDTVYAPASALTASSSHTNVTCNGLNNGTLTITVGGGTPPYTFLGNPVPSGTTTIPSIPPGTYAGNLTDANGCTVPLSETVTEPAVLAVSETHVNILCNGASTGSIDITVTGGTTAYSYNWGSGVTTEDRTNIPAGTYTVTVTDANLCTATLTVTLTEPTLLSVTETHVNVLCNGNSTGSIDITVTGGVTNYNYNWGGGVTTEDRTGIPAGTYTVTVTDANLCTGTVSATITEPTALTATSSHTNVTCNGFNNGTLTVTVGGGTPPYTFLGNPVPAGTTTIPSIPPGTYAGNLTDANGCAVPLSETVTEPGPQSLSVVGTNVSCNGGSDGTATAAFTNPTGAVTYDWNPGGILTGNRIGLTAGTYNVTATDGNGCSFAGTTTLTEPAPATMPVTATDALCFGSNGTATANPAGTAPFTFVWSAGSGGGNTQTINPPAGSYTVTATGNSTGCNETGSFTINQPAQILIDVAKVDVLCFGAATGSITLTPSAGAGAPFGFAWTPNVSSTNSATSLTAGNYTITVTDANSCTEDTVVTITEPASAVSATVAVVDVSCFGLTDGSVTVTPAGGVGGFTYIWNPNVSSSNAATGLGAGTYDVTISDANACTTTQTGTVVAPSAPLSFTQSQTDLTCFGVSTGTADVVAAGGTPGYTYTWSPNVSSGPNATSLAAGTYNLTVSDTHACTVTVTYNITQPAELIVTSTQTDNLCAGDVNGTITLTSTGGTGTHVYTWTPNVSSSNSAQNLPSGTYTFTVTDDNSCTDNGSATITEPAVLTVSATSTDALCFGDLNGTVTATSTGGTPSISYILSDGVNSIPSNSGLYTGLAASAYTVTATDANGCTATTNTIVAQPAAIINTVDSIDVTCYQYTDGQISIATAGGFSPFTYTLSNGTQNTTGIFTNLSTGSYTITVTDANNCSTQETATIDEPDSVVINATPNPIEINLGESIQIQTTTNQTGIVTYNWQPTQGLDCYDCANPGFSGNNSVEYQVVVTNQNGCTGSTEVTVTVIPAYNVFIPNVFTPNGDGNNDTWQIFGNMKGIKQIDVKVFNRIGEKVFESNDINYAWDGTYRGTLQPGVYVYTIRVVWLDNFSSKIYKGSVTVLR